MGSSMIRRASQCKSEFINRCIRTKVSKGRYTIEPLILSKYTKSIKLEQEIMIRRMDKLSFSQDERGSNESIPRGERDLHLERSLLFIRECRELFSRD